MSDRAKLILELVAVGLAAGLNAVARELQMRNQVISSTAEPRGGYVAPDF